MTVNGAVGALGIVGGELDVAISLRTVDGQVAEIFVVRNPDKLDHVRAPVRLTRD